MIIKRLKKAPTKNNNSNNNIEETQVPQRPRYLAIRELKEKCKELARQGVEQRKRIQDLSGIERYKAWDAKRDIGDEARIHYIAYALLRGKDYAKMEPNAKYERMSFGVLARHVSETLKKDYLYEQEYEEFSKANVKKLLLGHENEVRND